MVAGMIPAIYLLLVAVARIPSANSEGAPRVEWAKEQQEWIRPSWDNHKLSSKLQQSSPSKQHVPSQQNQEKGRVIIAPGSRAVWERQQRQRGIDVSKQQQRDEANAAQTSELRSRQTAEHYRTHCFLNFSSRLFARSPGNFLWNDRYKFKFFEVPKSGAAEFKFHAAHLIPVRPTVALCP